MDRFLGPLKARFSELVATMSPRDRKLFVGLVVGAYAVLLGGLWWFASGTLDDQASRIATQENNVAQLAGLAADETAAADKVTQINDQLRKYSDQDLPSFLEKSGQKVGVTALQMRERQVITEGEIEEHTFSVDVSKVSLDQLVSFLYEVETAGYPLKIRSMKTKVVTVSGAKLLNVSMEVSSFRLVGGEESSATGEKAG